MWEQLEYLSICKTFRHFHIIWSETLLRNIRWFKPICKLSPAKSKHNVYESWGKMKVIYMYNNDFIYLYPKFITSSPTVQKSVLHTQIWTILVFAWKIFQWEARRWTYTWWNKILACSSMFRSWWCQWYTIKSKINKPSYKWTPQNLAVGRD